LLYAGAVRGIATAITGDPATVNGYIARLRPATLLLAVAYIAGISAVVRAGLGRRLVMLAHVPLYVAMSLLTQALMIVTGMATGWPVAPFSIEATLANLLIGGLVIMRLTFTSFVLPRATTVPVHRPPSPWDTALTWCAVSSSVAILVLAYGLLASRSRHAAAWQVFLPLDAISLLFVLIAAPLWALWWFCARLPAPDADRLAIDVIVPAYNEADNIEQLLRSVDIAAARYGGPVRLIVSDDGSADGTPHLATEVISRLRNVRGEVLVGRNGGQSVALNRALAISNSPIVVRIDADCVMGPDALVYVAPWFRDPAVGSVGAMEEPRADGITWFHRLRALEALFQFRFMRLGQSLVDGVVVIPGTFTAFRRGPAMAVGGFPVGMNGEDTDLTMQLGRLGYRAVVDPRICCYEDVPRTAGEFVEQRTRWARAGFHVFARHEPLRSGLAGPRVWFWTARRGFSWFSLQAGMVAPIFLLELALTRSGYRDNVLTFALLYIAGSAAPLAVSIPLAIRYGHWRSVLWAPAWFAYAFLRRLGTLEAAISLPTRPFPAVAPAPASAPAHRGPSPTSESPAGPTASRSFHGLGRR
jgi:cellulose synthase/poly-beta-1,6-N-acetylglucosamine synthase-like glycosyltransferase